MEKKINKILEENVITFLTKTKNGYIIGIVSIDEFENNPDYHQQHFEGNDLSEIFDRILLCGKTSPPLDKTTATEKTQLTKKMKIKKKATTVKWICEFEGHEYLRTLSDFGTVEDPSIFWEVATSETPYINTSELEKRFHLTNSKPFKEESNPRRFDHDCYVLTDVGITPRIVVTFDQAYANRLYEGGNYIMKIAKCFDAPLSIDAVELLSKTLTEELKNCGKDQNEDKLDLIKTFEDAIETIDQSECKTYVSNLCVHIKTPKGLSIYLNGCLAGDPHIRFESVSQDITKEEFNRLHDRAVNKYLKRYKP